ncbi:MAG TPA: integration host factor, actinobacterial type [Trebonia sp.]|jgi:hypothetical protein
MPLPDLTPEQREAALAKAAATRTARAEVKNRLKTGDVTLMSVIDDADPLIVGRMKVTALLQAVPGIGKARAAQIMARIGIAETRRVAGLGKAQRAALAAEFAPAA